MRTGIQRFPYFRISVFRVIRTEFRVFSPSFIKLLLPQFMFLGKYFRFRQSVNMSHLEALP